MGVVEKYIYISSIQALDQVTVLVGQKSNRKVVPFQCNFGSRSLREERISGNVLTKVKYGERFGYIWLYDGESQLLGQAILLWKVSEDIHSRFVCGVSDNGFDFALSSSCNFSIQSANALKNSGL